MNRTEPIRDEDKLADFLGYYAGLGRHRDNLLVNMGVRAALSAGDLLKLRMGDAWDFEGGRVKSRIRLTEGRTGRARVVVLRGGAREALRPSLESLAAGAGPESPLFANAETGRPLSRSQAHRIIAKAAAAAGIPHRVSSTSLRKTLGWRAWRDADPHAELMDIYSRRSHEAAKSYLCAGRGRAQGEEA